MASDRRAASLRWLLAGIVLDVAGVGLIVWSFAEDGPPLAAGVACLLAGAAMVAFGASGIQEAAGTGPSSSKARPRWTPEPEIRQSAPRAVRLVPAAKVIGAVWLITITLGAWFAYDRLWSLEQPLPGQYLIEEEGVRGIATIHRKETRTSASGQTRYYLYYNFADESGSGLRSSISVRKPVFDRHREGDAVEVRYLAGDPLAHYLPSLHRSPFAMRGAMMIGVVLAFAFYLAEAQRRKHHRLVKYGEAAPGAVEKLSRRGGGRRLEIRYEAGGRAFRFKTTERNPERRAGDIVTVMYDPGEPEEAILYSTALYRAAPQD